jgi:DNA-binding GntR family transcriptional regulator
MAIGDAPSGTAALRSLPKDTLRDRVYEGLRETLLRGGFAPGEALTVRSLAAAFGTSPTPVREALQQLVAESALEAEPNRSYRVPQISRDSFLEIRDMRAELEGLAAEKAALLIRPGEIRRLELAIERMAKAIAQQDVKAYLAANQDFHFVVYIASRSPILLRTIRALWMQIGPCLNMLFSDIELVEGLQDHHLAAVAAFRAGGAAEARTAIRADILAAGSHIGRQMTAAG